MAGCDTKSLRCSGRKTPIRVQDRFLPLRASSVTRGCEARGQAQGRPEPSGLTGRGKGGTGERESTWDEAPLFVQLPEAMVNPDGNSGLMGGEILAFSPSDTQAPE